MAFEKDITLTANGKDWKFKVNATAFNKYLNSLGKQANMVQSATNFLTSTIDEKQRKEFIEFVQLPGAAINLVGPLVEEYQEDFEVTVKK